jgi:hypothetical protein
MEELIKKLEDLTKIACADGTWNYDPYFHGMANGMILCLAIAKDEPAKFLTAPKEWLGDIRRREEMERMEKKE